MAAAAAAPAAMRCCAMAFGIPQASRLSAACFASTQRNVNDNVKLRSSSRKYSVHAAAAAAISELVPPPIDDDFQDLLRECGADISEDGVVETFGRDEEAYKAADTGCAIIEMSHFGKLRVTGDDRLRFLHNQSTADILPLKDGEGCDTVFVTNTARTVDLATAWVMKTAVILFVSPNTRHELVQLLNKYIFFSDKVEIEDITEKTSCFSILGPESDNIMRQLSLELLIDKPYGTHVHYAANGAPVTVGVGSGLATKGYTFLLSTAAASPVWDCIVKSGAVPVGATGWERLRILQGRPAAGKELTNEFNVLEAGLYKTISLSKGCYIGQETVARLITYDGVKQQLFGLDLSAAAPAGSQILTTTGVKAGKLTSCTGESPFFGLGYIRKQADVAPGCRVDIGGVKATIVNAAYVDSQQKTTATTTHKQIKA